jgi:hypothetical protein
MSLQMSIEQRDQLLTKLKMDTNAMTNESQDLSAEEQQVQEQVSVPSLTSGGGYVALTHRFGWALYARRRCWLGWGRSGPPLQCKILCWCSVPSGATGRKYL